MGPATIRTLTPEPLINDLSVVYKIYIYISYIYIYMYICMYIYIYIHPKSGKKAEPAKVSSVETRGARPCAKAESRQIVFFFFFGACFFLFWFWGLGILVVGSCRMSS